MAVTHYPCDLYQGYNYKKDVQTHMGFVNSMTIGTTVITADTSVIFPTADTTQVKVAGVLSEIYWEGGNAEPIMMDFNVSIANKVLIATLLQTNMSNTNVVFEFTVYEYDPVAYAYYSCFSSNSTTVNGVIRKVGGDLDFACDTVEASEVQMPKNFRVHMGISPNDTSAMVLQLAMSSTATFMKQWGVPSSGG